MERENLPEPLDDRKKETGLRYECDARRVGKAVLSLEETILTIKYFDLLMFIGYPMGSIRKEAEALPGGGVTQRERCDKKLTYAGKNR